MDLQDVYFWIYQGYADAREGEPYKRAPDYPEEVLRAPEEALPEEVKAYWEGWQSGVYDNVRDVLNKVRRQEENGSILCDND